MFYYDVLKALYKSKIRYLIAGGVAVNIHNVPRMTNDIDFILALEPANIAAFVKLMKKSGYVSRLPVDPKMLTDLNKLNQWKKEKNLKAFSFYHKKDNYKVIDIVVEHPLDFEEAYRNKTVKKIKDIKIYCVSLNDLIKMKRKSRRERDLNDIALLKKAKKLSEQNEN